MSQAEDKSPGSLWRDRRFRLFWSGQTVSQFGDRITELALPLMAVTVLSASAMQVAVLTAAIWTPNLAAIVIGAWVDTRPDKRRLMIIADLLRVVVLFSLPVAYAAGVLTIAQLIVVALLSGVGQVLFDMVYQAFFVALVPRSQYLDANSKLSLTRSASYVAGPAVGGVLIQVLTAPIAFVVDAASFLYSAIVISRIRVLTAPVVDRHEPLRSRIAGGIRVIADSPFLRASLGCSATMNFFMFAAQALMILFASQQLGLSAGFIGLALGLGAIGGLIGAAVAGQVTRLLGVGRTIMVGAVLYPLPVALLALADGPYWARAGFLAAAEVISSIGVMFFDVGNNSLRAAVTPDNVRSRTAGAYTVVNYGSRPLGALAGGWLGTAIGLRPTLLIAAVCGSLGVLWLLASPIPRTVTLPEPATAGGSSGAG